MQNRIFSTDSAKAIKAQEYGYLNAIHYLAPADMSGFDLCAYRSPGCTKGCLGWESGQAGMVKHDEDLNEVRKSRIAKSQRFMKSRAAYMLDVVRSVDNENARAARADRKLCVRMNGASDIGWEGIRFTVTRDAKGKAMAVTLDNRDGRNLFDHYPELAFVDYTKNYKRFDRKLPANYHLTFSRSEINEAIALQLLARGVNVAVVFAHKPEPTIQELTVAGCSTGNWYSKPATWNGFSVIDGDKHDLRQLDPRGERGFVVALSPKGRKAKKDTSGFVIHSTVQ